MQITGFLKQTATHEPLLPTTDAWGDQKYGPAVEIAVRKTRSEKASRKGQSYKVDYQTKYLTAVLVNNGDRLDGQEILQVEDIVDFAGNRIGTTSYPSESTTLG